ncbi:MAG: hypothetical protein FGF51_01690 [Candidatus Brockarchaeota archaeon]|nr:hypothetical protein [Candidatus Brockarchaeota archaeon]
MRRIIKIWGMMLVVFTVLSVGIGMGAQPLEVVEAIQEEFAGGCLKITVERGYATIYITINVEFRIKDLGSDVKLMGYNYTVEEEGGKLVLGPTIAYMPVWPAADCQSCKQGKKASGIQTSVDRIKLPVSELRDCEYVVKVSIFVVEGVVVKKELPRAVNIYRKTLVNNPSNYPVPELPEPENTVPDLSNCRIILFSDKTRFNPLRTSKNSLGLIELASADVDARGGSYLDAGTYPCWP